MKKRLFFLGILPLLLLSLFLLKELEGVFRTHLVRADFFNLQQKSAARYVERDFLKDSDHRENSLYFLFSKELQNQKKILIPRFRVSHGKILSVLDIANTQSMQVRFEKLKTISFHNLVDLEKSYSFTTDHDLFKPMMNERSWAKALSLLFESSTEVLLKKYWAKLWFLKEVRHRFYISQNTHYDIMQLGNRSFCLMFAQKSKTMTLFSLGEKETSIYRLEGEYRDIESFLSSFLSRAQWIDLDTNIPFPESKNNFTVFTILDFFTFTKLLPKHRNMIEEYTVEYFRYLLANKKLSEVVKELITSSLREIQVISTLKDKRGEPYYSEAFRLDVEQLLHTLREIYR